jgi:cytochrome P450 family 135
MTTTKLPATTEAPLTAPKAPRPRRPATALSFLAATLSRARSANAARAAFPPGPRLPRLIQAGLFVLVPLPFLEACRRRYGGIFTLRLPEYGYIFYVSDVAMIEQVFTADATIMHAGEANSVLEPVTGPGSVLVLDEDEHLRHRRMLLPPLHGQALQGYEQLIDEVARRHMDGWPTGEPVRLRPLFQAVTLEVIISAIFGRVEDVPESANAEHRQVRSRELMDLLNSLFDLSAGKILLLALTRWLTKEGSPRSTRRTREAIDRLLMREIERRRSEGHGEGILGLLLDARDEQNQPMADAEICDELVTMLLAGHETTATALSWTFERLVRHPQALRQLEDELGEQQRPYLDATLTESLRIRPVVMDVGRRLTQPVELGGYRLDAGTYILPSIALVHASGEHYEQPEKFRPERFVGVRPPKAVWFPFGGGRRRCLGAAFAMFEMQLLVTQVLARFAVSAVREEDERVRLRGITLVPSRDCEVILNPRGN